MKTRIRNNAFNGFIFVLFALICMACGASAEHASVSFTGTVQHYDLEGGFYAIEADDGTIYDPANLASEYHVPGLRVQVEALIREDMAGTHQVGTIIEIQSIKTL